jgi:hypothetical protein
MFVLLLSIVWQPVMEIMECVYQIILMGVIVMQIVDLVIVSGKVNRILSLTELVAMTFVVI